MSGSQPGSMKTITTEKLATFVVGQQVQLKFSFPLHCPCSCSCQFFGNTSNHIGTNRSTCLHTFPPPPDRPCPLFRIHLLHSRKKLGFKRKRKRVRLRRMPNWQQLRLFTKTSSLPLMPRALRLTRLLCPQGAAVMARLRIVVAVAETACAVGVQVFPPCPPHLLRRPTVRAARRRA